MKAVADAIAPVLERGNLVIQVDVTGRDHGEADGMARRGPARFELSPAGSQSDFGHFRRLAAWKGSSKDRVLIELVDNDRIIGGVSPECAQKAVAFYQIFLQGECHVTNAAIRKWQRDGKLVPRRQYRFANELSLICDHLDMMSGYCCSSPTSIRGSTSCAPARAVGGHCIAIDPWFIVSSAPDQARLIRTARNVNDEKPDHVIAKVEAFMLGSKAPVIACLRVSPTSPISTLRDGAPVYASPNND